MTVDPRRLVVALDVGEKAALEYADVALGMTLNAIKEVLLDGILNPDGDGAWPMPSTFDEIAAKY